MKRYGYGVGLLVVGFAATYVLVYLYRWEWNRALISAALLLVAEVALVGVATADRLRRIEGKLDSVRRDSQATMAALVVPSTTIPAQAEARGDLSRVVPAHTVVSDPRSRDLSSNGDSPISFPWLRDPDEPADRFGVFIPILMGAGILLSGIAWLVERLARSASRVHRRGGQSDPLGYLSLPPGGPFAAGELPVENPLADTRLVDRRASVRRGIAAAVGALVIVGLGVPVLADMTQSRSDPDLSADASIVTIDASSNVSGATELSARAQRQWELCRDTSNLGLQTSSLLQVDTRRFVGVVTPALGEQAERRFRGCLTDLRINYLQLHVASIEHVDEQPAAALAQSSVRSA